MSLQVPYSAAKSPPIPVVVLDLFSPDGSESLLGQSGTLDTAADRTVVPLTLLGQLKLRPTAQVRAQGFGSGVFTIDVYQVRVVILGVIDVVVDALGQATEPGILLGRDILTRLRITFDGPNNTVEFH